jgi:DNA-binding NarL/FixJ family response regulator
VTFLETGGSGFGFSNSSVSSGFNRLREGCLATPSIRVLLVDDYEPFRQFLSSRLQGASSVYLCWEASDGLEAVQKAEELQPDLILLDIGLPKLNGIEVARRIRKVSLRSKILFVSQEWSAAAVQEALDTGAEGYLVKTDARRELLEGVNAVLRGERFVGRRFSGQLSPKKKV